MDPSDDSHESHRSNQYADAQDRHAFPGFTGNYNVTNTGGASSPRTRLSGTSTRSSIPSRPSFASDTITVNTASTQRTSFESSSSAHPTCSSDNRQETDVATSSTRPDSATDKTAMYCVCCWEPKQELTKHYPRCPYIKGDWAFWACPYAWNIWYDREVFINHIKSFKPDEKRVEVNETISVTAREWAIKFSEDAKKRQLVNTVFAYFDANPRQAKEWKALNNGMLIPDLNNVAHAGKMLMQSSILRRRPPLGPPRSVEEVSIDQLQQLFQVGTKAGAKAQAQSDVSSKERQRNSTPVRYNALESVNKDAQVAIGDAHFDNGELAKRQQQQPDEHNQKRSLRYGGVFVHSRVGTENLAPTNTSPTARTSSMFANQTRETHVVSNNVSSNPAEFQYRLQDDLRDHGGIGLPPPVPQTMQQTQSANVFAGANDASNAPVDYSLDGDVDPAFWKSLLNDPDL